MLSIIFLCMGLVSLNAYGDTCFPGENLWQMTQNICGVVEPCCSVVEEIFSVVESTSSELDICCSVVDVTNSVVERTASVLDSCCSVIDTTNSVVERTASVLDGCCSVVDATFSIVDTTSSGLDACCSTVDALYDCTIGTVITQAMLPLVTIATSGHYRLCGNLSTGVLVISANDVTLDLGGYYIDGIGIQVNSGFKNIVIRNGTIKNVPTAIDISSNTSNILIENIVIDTIIPNPSGPEFAIRVSSGPATGLTIQNVSVYNGCRQNFVLNNIKGLKLEDISFINTNSLFTTALGFGAILRIINSQDVVLKSIDLADQFNGAAAVVVDTCTDVQIDDLSISTTLAAFLGGRPDAFTVNASENVFITNSFINSGSNSVYEYGFFLGNTSNNITMENCSSGYNNNVGFVAVTRSSGSIYKNCTAHNNGVYGFFMNGYQEQFINCNAYVNGVDGFLIGIACENLLLDGCISAYNVRDGFAANLSPDGVLATEYYGCIAQKNGRNGFTIDNNGTLSFCNSVNNTVDGFLILGTQIVNGHKVVLRQCLASTNRQRGINNLSAAANFLYIIDTRSSSTAAPVYQLNQLPDVFGINAVVVTF